MKKSILFLLAILAFTTLHAQWNDDPMSNNLVVNASDDAEEIILSTDVVSGNTYVQWSDMASNGWTVFLQRLDLDGMPQWGENGIYLTDIEFPPYDSGRDMTATLDNSIVSCFANDAGYCIAVKLRANGSYPWGKAGITVFTFPQGKHCEEAKVLPCANGGVWVLASDGETLYLRFIYANGNMCPIITINDSQKECANGRLVSANDNGVFVVFEKRVLTEGTNYDKEIYVMGYTFEGNAIGPATQLMSSKNFDKSYCPYVISDGMGGGYAYIWHPAVLNALNIYVFHFDENGTSTISNPNGISLHSPDPDTFLLDAYGTIDSQSHDLILAYKMANPEMTLNTLYANRITTSGERLWGEGMLVENSTSREYNNIKVDAAEDEEIYVVTFTHGNEAMGGMTVEARGLDQTGTVIWENQMNSVIDMKAGCRNSTGFHFGQNIIVWNNLSENKIYGQNIQPDGTMGLVTVSLSCNAPENFQGEYHYDNGTFGALLSWTTPSEPLIHYNLYFSEYNSNEEKIIELDPSLTSFFHVTHPGMTQYKLTAVYSNCESSPALTPEGDYYVVIDITSVPETADEEIVTPLHIYNMQGQLIRNTDMETLSSGIYILQGLTQDGKTVSKKIVVD